MTIDSNKIYSQFNNTNTATGYLLIHGFGGNVNEVKPLGKFLEKQGCRVVYSSLKGHTGIREDLKKCTYMEWIVSAQEGYDKLKQECDSIFIIGFSMGGLIAFQIASSHAVKAVVTLNTPIYYWDIKRVAINIVNDLRVKRFDSLKRYVNSSWNLPFNALINFRLLLSKTKPLLKDIQCPVFVVQALEDDTVRKSSAYYIHSNIGSTKKKIEFYKDSEHLILWSKASEQVIADVSEFMADLDGFKPL